jgi:UDP:flavonoid glycosyltransferase YjiC (YdhE family)
MRILFGATPAAGHLLPLLPLADAAAAAGHQVAFLTAAPMARFLGARPLLPAGPDFGELIAHNERHGGDAANFGDAAAELFAGTRVDLTWNEAFKQALDFSPDLIVAEWVDFVTPLLAARLQVPWAAHSIGGPLPAEFATAMRKRSDQQHSRRTLLPQERIALVDPFPDLLRLPTDSAAERDRVTIRLGSIDFSLAGQTSRPMPPRTAGTPRALLSMGTSVNDPALLAKLAHSIADAGVDVLVTADPLSLPPHPHVHAIGFTPLGEVLDDVGVVVGSAGSGTLLAALDAGVPLVLSPVLADQPLNAARAAHRGVAQVLNDAADAGKVVRRVLGDPAHRRAAQEVATELTRFNSPGQALAELLRRR